MRWLPALLALLIASPAQAITTTQAGFLLHAGGGGTFEIGAPSLAAPGWSAGASVWWGRYDDVYALGRFTAVGVVVRQAWIARSLETIPALEVRRGNDVLVFGYHGFLAAGPVIRGDAIGVEALLGGGVKWRFRPRWGLVARAGAGAAWLDQRWRARMILRLEIEAASPFRRADAD